MKTDLTKYTEESILASYEFIFSFWLGGQYESIKDMIPTVELFEECLKGLRVEYLSRKDAKIEEMTKIEKGCMERLSSMLNLNSKGRREVYEKLWIQAEESFREIKG